MIELDRGWPPPSADEVRAWAARRTRGDEARALECLLALRSRVIADARADPLEWGYEPDIWQVAWALLDVPFTGIAFLWRLRGLYGAAEPDPWGRFRREMRAALGFPAPVRDLLVMGANRSGKTDFAAKTLMRLASKGPGRQLMFFLAQQMSLSAETVQPRLWRYFPPANKTKHLGEDWYVHYKDLKGFTDAAFQLPNRTKVLGKFYSQNPADALVGSEADFAWADELVPQEWVDELGRRLASRRGKLLLTFTPIEGWTPVVKRFLEGAEYVRRIPAYLLPRDGGGPEPWSACGLARAAWDALAEAVRAGREAECPVPASVPENCLAWLSPPAAGAPAAGSWGVADDGRAEWRRADGRVFEAAPRVARCRDANMAAIWFETMDNPYSGPSELISREAASAPERVRTILYGVAVKSRSAVFAAFDEGVHVVDDAAVPARGANYCLLDPAGRRNDALIWVRSTPEADYVYREWPGSYEIPGVGVPEPWAVESGKGRAGDGKLAGGAESFGFGFRRMKAEIARLEGWPCFTSVDAPEDEVLEWSEDGAAEPIEERFMDSRPAAARRMENDGEVTLLDQWNRMGGWDWRTTPGDSIDEGVGMVQEALGSRRLFVARSCGNVVFALANWTGADGAKGACKDWIDLLRYFYRLGLSRCANVPPWRLEQIMAGPDAGAGGAAPRRFVGAGGRSRGPVARFSARRGGR